MRPRRAVMPGQRLGDRERRRRRRAAREVHPFWALGTILYEMIAGKRAFEAPSQASLIASILDREPPPLTAVAPLTPPFLDHVVARCLAKSPDECWRDAHDLADVLRGVRDGAGIRLPTTVPTRPASWRRAAAAGTVLVLGAAVAAIFMLPTPSRRYTIVLPADKPLAPGGIMPEAADRPALALTRDGTRLAYVAKIGDTTQNLHPRHVQRDASLAACPRHPRGGCGFVRHGTYARRTPVGLRIARYHCPTARETFSLLPDCLASHFPGALDAIEHVVATVETARSVEAAADVLRPEITLPSGVRWVRRRLTPIRRALLAIVTLLPDLFTGDARLGAVRLALATPSALVALRTYAAPHVPTLPTPLGFHPPHPARRTAVRSPTRSGARPRRPAQVRIALAAFAAARRTDAPHPIP